MVIFSKKKKKKTLHIKCVFWLSLQHLSETCLTLWRIQRDFIISVHMCPCKVPVVLEYFWQIFEKYEMPWKSVQWTPSCHMRTDKQTYRQTDGRVDKKKLIVVFRNFSNTTTNWSMLSILVQYGGDVSIFCLRASANWTEGPIIIIIIISSSSEVLLRRSACS